MRRHALSVIAITGVVAAVATIGGTLAALSTTKVASSGVVGSAVVVLGGPGTSPVLDFTNLRPGVAQTFQLEVDYRGTVPAQVGLQLAAAGTTSAYCERVNGSWKSLASGSIILSLGSRAPQTYCNLLDDDRRVVADAVPPGSHVAIPVTVELSPAALPAMLGRSDHATLTMSASGGFTSAVQGSLSISTVGRDTPSPSSASATTAEAIALPAECAAAGLDTGSATVVTLGPSEQIWTAPAGAGPLVVIGTDGDDTIRGGDAPDCIVGGGGNDTADGSGGADVLVGGTGADALTGGAGDDRLYGGADHDALTGGDGADLIDGGPDGGSCDVDPADTATECDPPGAEVTTTPPPTTTPVQGPPQQATAQEIESPSAPTEEQPAETSRADTPVMSAPGEAIATPETTTATEPAASED